MKYLLAFCLISLTAFLEAQSNNDLPSMKLVRITRPKHGNIARNSLINENLTNIYNFYYMGSVDIGTPINGTQPQTFLVNFDTGSSDFWVPSVSCVQTRLGCKGHMKYSSNLSSTYVPNGYFY